MVLRVQMMRALVPCTASTKPRVAECDAGEMAEEIQRHALGG